MLKLMQSLVALFCISQTALADDATGLYGKSIAAKFELKTMTTTKDAAPKLSSGPEIRTVRFLPNGDVLYGTAKDDAGDKGQIYKFDREIDYLKNPELTAEENFKVLNFSLFRGSISFDSGRVIVRSFRSGVTKADGSRCAINSQAIYTVGPNFAECTIQSVALIAYCEPPNSYRIAQTLGRVESCSIK